MSCLQFLGRNIGLWAFDTGMLNKCIQNPHKCTSIAHFTNFKALCKRLLLILWFSPILGFCITSISTIHKIKMANWMLNAVSGAQCIHCMRLLYSVFGSVISNLKLIWLIWFIRTHWINRFKCDRWILQLIGYLFSELFADFRLSLIQCNFSV